MASWKDQFKRYKGEWDKFNAKHNILPGSQGQNPPTGAVPQGGAPAQWQQQHQQQQINRPPPQQLSPQHLGGQLPGQNTSNTQGTFSTQAQGGLYWQGNFIPGLPVVQDWDAKIGNNNGWGNNELQHYTGNPENAFFTNDNKLVLRAIANSANPNPAQKYTSARLVSRQRLARDRGSLTVVLSSPCAPGIWPAFWLLPFEPFSWPTDGEVDIAETWNGDRTNHSCLHWGFFSPQDATKHRVIDTHIPDMADRPVKYEFAWDQPGGAPGQGRLMYWIDGRPTMKAWIPGGMRPMRDFNILLNIAMGGNVTQGQIPRDGAYDFVVHWMGMADEMEGGWGRFERDWNVTPEGRTN